MNLPDRSVCVSGEGAQNPENFDRGIPRYVAEQLQAICAVQPSVLHSVLLNPDMPLVSNLNWLLGSGLLRWSTPELTRRSFHQLPRVYHMTCPFSLATPLDVMWPRWARDADVATVVTLYDLIPLIFSDHYLRDPFFRAEYTARSGLIRHTDMVLALSENTARDAVERLGVRTERIHVIHAGVSDRFAAMYRSPTAAWTHLSHHLRAVRPGFLLYVGGFEFRKNLERTIAAYGMLPARIRAAHQLVISCRLGAEQRDYLRAEAAQAGVGDDELLLPGYVTDFDLGALYHACSLFMFPSFYEGSGLPVLEAMSCGAPVIASSTSTSPELLGDREGTFDPNSVASIAACVEQTITAPTVLARLRERSRERARLYTWRRVAERTLEAYERAITRRPRSRRRRPRVALVTPWPPDVSGAAEYSSRLVPELAQRVDVDVVVANDPAEHVPPSGRGVRLLAAQQFAGIDGLAIQDRTLYCMGAAQAHRHVYELLLRRPGAVLFHDVRLVDFYGSYLSGGGGGDAGHELRHQIEMEYRSRFPSHPSLHDSPVADQCVAWGVYMSREVQEHAELCLVHSRFAHDALQLDRESQDPGAPISVIPLAIPATGVGRAPRQTRSPSIVSVGPIDEHHGAGSLISAFGLLAADVPNARLLMADPGPCHQLDYWRAYASDHAPGGDVALRDRMSGEQCLAEIDAADLAVQLRSDEDGDSSRTVAELISRGIPTIVSALGWPGELPDGTVVKVGAAVEPRQLGLEIRRLVDHCDERIALAEAARDHATRHGFGRVAEACLEALELS